MTNKICVGAVSGSFGVMGEVRLKSFCADPEAIAAYGPLTNEEGTRSYTIKITRSVAGGLGVRMSGVSTKEEADALKGLRLFADRSKLPSLPDDEFYHADLIGLNAHDTGGVLLGKVIAVHNHGAGDLLELQQANGKSTQMIPFTMAVVPTVDLKSARLVVDMPEGLD
jgi:16S rRNA processing protein RimM